MQGWDITWEAVGFGAFFVFGWLKRRKQAGTCESNQPDPTNRERDAEELYHVAELPPKDLVDMPGQHRRELWARAGRVTL